MNVGLQILILALLLILSSFFSASETAFSTVNRIRLKSRADNGDKKAKRVLALTEHYDHLLMAILVGNNVVNIASASLATVLFTSLIGDAGVTVSTIVMTVLVLFFGEVTPKSLAKEFPEKFSYFAVPFMSVLVKILAPVSALFISFKKMMNRRLPGGANEHAITEEELMTYVDVAKDDGGIDEHESDLIRSAIEFHDRNVEEVLTPRVDITAIEDSASVLEIERLYNETGYSRLPVYHESVDNIIGVLHEHDFYSSRAKGKFILAERLGRIICVQGALKISALMRKLQQEKLHMAVVLDEFGGTLGIVTLEDVIEELVGEIWDEHDEVVVFFLRQADGSTIVNASVNLEDLFDHFAWGNIPKNIEAVTAAGWAAENLGCIAEAGSEFYYGDCKIVVHKADKRRVIELRVIPRSKSPAVPKVSAGA